MTMSTHDRPQPTWLPLRRAVFRFGLEHEHLDLAEVLREKSGADQVEIDTGGPEPAFVFTWIDGDNEFCLGGAPWAILAEPPHDHPLAERPANLKPATAQEQAVMDARCQAVRAATGLVWRQFMVRTFDRAIQAGEIVLFGRPGKVTAEFMPVPADVWPMMEVVDWASGTAIAPDGTAFFSIYATTAAAMLEVVKNTDTEASKAPTKRGAPHKYDYDVIRGEAFRLFRARGLPIRDGDEGWQTRSDLEDRIADFCMKIYKNSPAKSTLQRLAERTIEDWKAEGR